MKLGGAVLAACATLAASWKFGEHYGGIDISDFEIDNASRTCHHDPMAHPFNEQVRGVNIGSWMVLEPWITPSLFYQFEDEPKERVAMDMLNFCRVLGPEEGNRQLREHWRRWVTEDDIRQLAAQGINTLLYKKRPLSQIAPASTEMTPGPNCQHSSPLRFIHASYRCLFL